GDVNSEPPAQNPLRKKTGRAKKQAKKGQSSSLEGNIPLEETPSSVDASEVTKKKKKKKDSKKRSREEASVERLETSMAVGEDDAGTHDPTDSTRESPEERPKKKAKKKVVEEGGQRSVDGDRPDGILVPEGPSRSGGRASETGDGSRDEYPLSKRALPSSARGKGVESGGSVPKKAGTGFPDRVKFLYDEKTPLNEYIDAASASKRSDGSMNYLVEKYDSTLKHTKIQLGASEKLAQTRLGVIERLRAENKKASDKAAKEKEPMVDITSALSERVDVTEGIAFEECSDKNNPGIDDNLVREEETRDLAVEDPVLVSSSEE
ncbi:hypothetical protein HID58_013608, partial [Brassica napus]